LLRRGALLRPVSRFARIFRVKDGRHVAGDPQESGSPVVGSEESWSFLVLCVRAKKLVLLRALFQFTAQGRGLSGNLGPV